MQFLTPQTTRRRVVIADRRRGVLDAEIVGYLSAQSATAPETSAVTGHFVAMGWPLAEVEGALDTLWRTGRVTITSAHYWHDNPDSPNGRGHITVLGLVP